MAIYWRGLKHSVKEELLCYSGWIDDLKILIKESVEIDNKFYKLELKG